MAGEFMADSYGARTIATRGFTRGPRSVRSDCTSKIDHFLAARDVDGCACGRAGGVFGYSAVRCYI